MTGLSIYPYLEKHKYSSPIDLFHQSGSSNGAGPRTPCLTLLIDGESCLDRLYGGTFTDWVGGGQWNRMFDYLTNLHKAYKHAGVIVTVAFRGGDEEECVDEISRMHQIFNDRLTRVLTHLKNKATPPPKVWWLAPTCLREMLCSSLHSLGIPTYCTTRNYYHDIILYMKQHKCAGIVTDNVTLALVTHARVFGAHDLKLTYKGNLETKEYFVREWLECFQITEEKWVLIIVLLGWLKVGRDSLVEFHEEISRVKSANETLETMAEVVSCLVDYIRNFPEVGNLDALGHVIFRNSSVELSHGICQLKESVEFLNTILHSQQPFKKPHVMRSVLNVPLKEINTTGSLLGQQQIKLTDWRNASAKVTIQPNKNTLQIAAERHRKGLMSPIIHQCLTRREVNLQPIIENVLDIDAPPIYSVYQPIRETVYAILHNLNKHLFDTQNVAQQSARTFTQDDIHIEVTERSLSALGVTQVKSLLIRPLTWPVPSLESLWLSPKPENIPRRIHAFYSCWEVPGNHQLTDRQLVPEKYTILCCILRYLLKHHTKCITLTQVNAVLCMATSGSVTHLDQTQNRQIAVITADGAHLASMVMAGIQHAIMVNDVCGAPLRPDIHSIFDGRVLQEKLNQCNHGCPNLLELCDRNMGQVILVERLLKAITSDVRTVPDPATASKMVSAPNRLPQPPKAPPPGVRTNLRGTSAAFKASMDSRGGKLQIAGQVVSSWSPHPEHESRLAEQNAQESILKTANNHHQINHHINTGGSRPNFQKAAHPNKPNNPPLKLTDSVLQTPADPCC